MTEIKGYHAHIYFDEKTVDQARGVCESARDMFGVKMGRMHERPVGPHPRWSCQLAFAPDLFAKVITWLALNRDELIVFCHPETGDEVADHTKHAIWMGTGLDLDLSVLDGCGTI